MQRDDGTVDDLVRRLEEEIAEQRRLTAEAAAEDGIDDAFDGPPPPRTIHRTDDYPITNGAGRETNGTFAPLPERSSFAAGQTSISNEEFYRLVQKIAFLEKRARGIDVATAVMAVKAIRRHTDLLEHEAVAYARSRGWSWRTIGHVLGVHGAALHKRYGQEMLPKRTRPKRAT